jgi:hypothetical protein
MLDICGKRSARRIPTLKEVHDVGAFYHGIHSCCWMVTPPLTAFYSNVGRQATLGERTCSAAVTWTLERYRRHMPIRSISDVAKAALAQIQLGNYNFARDFQALIYDI